MVKLWRDIGVAIRVLRKSPGMTAVALISLALGIGANTAIFSLLNAVVLRPLAVPHPEQLVSLATTVFDESSHDEGFTWPMVEEFNRQQNLFSDIFCWNAGSVSNYEVDGVHYAGSLAQASGTYYKAMQVAPLVGRFIGPKDFGAGNAPSHPVAVISYRAWRNWFHGSGQVIGGSIRLDGHWFTVIGVEPEEFSGLSLDGASDVTVPLFAPGTSADRSDRIIGFALFARLKPGENLSQARAGLQNLWPQIQKAAMPSDYSGERSARFFARKVKIESARTGVSSLRRRFSHSLQILMAIVGAVLFIACLNIANLSLAKAAAERHQSGVRAALGANAWDLIRPALVESLLLSCGGALFGLLLAYWTSHLLIAMAWTGYVATTINPSLDFKVLAFTAFVAILAGVLFGTVPAFYSARIDPIEALKQQSRSVQGGAHFVGRALLITQVAVSLVLILGALLFSRTLSALHNTDVGYRRDHLLTLVLFPQAGSTLPQNAIAYYQNLADQVRRLPGVISVSYSYNGPANEFEPYDQIFGTLASPATSAIRENVTPGFFSLAGMHVLRGREFQWSDATHDPVILSQSLAQSLFPNQDPVGRVIYRGPHAFAYPLTILGVVNSASLWKVESVHPLAYYQLLELGPGWDEPLMDVRTSVDPQTLKTAIEKVIRAQGHHYSLRTMTVDERLDSYITIQRLTALLSEFFGGVALLIACVGLYGLMSYQVTRRTSELGIRSALGANRRHLLLMILQESLLLTAYGCVLGVIASLAFGRFIKSILFGVSPTDPINIAIAVVTMLAVAIAAAYIPARRAAHVDPMTALRAE